MAVQVYGCNHVVIEVDDVNKAVTFYKDVFNLEKMDEGEGDAFFKLGEHQFLAIFKVERLQPDRMRHFGILVRDEAQISEVREKVSSKYRYKLEPEFSLRLPRSLGKSDPSRGFARRVVSLVASVPRSSEGRYQIRLVTSVSIRGQYRPDSQTSRGWISPDFAS